MSRLVVSLTDLGSGRSFAGSNEIRNGQARIVFGTSRLHSIEILLPKDAYPIIGQREGKITYEDGVLRFSDMRHFVVVLDGLKHPFLHVIEPGEHDLQIDIHRFRMRVAIE